MENKKELRDSLIDDKLKSLETIKEELRDKLKGISVTQKTNLKFRTRDGRLIVIRTIRDKNELALILGELLRMKSDYETGKQESGEKFDGSLMIEGYPIEDWILDVKNFIRKVSIEERIDGIEKAIKELPNYYTSDKKEDINFNNLLKSIDKLC